MSAQLTTTLSGLMILSGLFLTACAKDITVLRSTVSPNGKRSATVLTVGPYLAPRQIIRMEVADDGKRHVIFETEPRKDVNDCLVAIGWSADSTLVGFFVRPCYANSTLTTGYDFIKQSVVPELNVQDLLRSSIQGDFNFAPRVYDDPYFPHAVFISDPLDWAKRSYDATAQYATKYKQGRTSGNR
jgi:hypothetical protein